MKCILISFLLSLIFFTGCTTLDISEIQGLQRENFNPLRFTPTYEANDLRIDIIRQTITDTYSDSSGAHSETRNVPYQTMGFDLGNGLFFDLNKNLSLRLDTILGISDPGDFTIDVANYHGTGRRSVEYRMKNDSLTVSYPPRNKEHFRYAASGSPDSLVFKYRGRRPFVISRDGKDENYRNGRRIVSISLQPSTGDYFLVHKNRKKTYQRSGNELYLEKYYRVRLNDDRTVLEIGRGRGNHRLILSMIKSGDSIYIFDKRFRGLKIRKGINSTELYRNNKLITEFSTVR
jgi:hypothetical protein